ncbi:MAG: hypothetical protein ACYC0V_21825, partial [Armatimonadota bacterium]
MYYSQTCKSNARRTCSLPWASVLVVVLLFVALPSIATTYYVSPTGDDSGSGTVEMPWKSIDRGDALQVLQPGDVVKVQEGEYRQVEPDGIHLSQCSGTGSKPIIYKACGLVAIEGNSEGESAGFRISSNYVVIDGFKIGNCRYGVYF